MSASALGMSLQVELVLRRHRSIAGDAPGEARGPLLALHSGISPGRPRSHANDMQSDHRGCWASNPGQWLMRDKRPPRCPVAPAPKYAISVRRRISASWRESGICIFVSNGPRGCLPIALSRRAGPQLHIPAAAGPFPEPRTHPPDSAWDRPPDAASLGKQHSGCARRSSPASL